MKTSKYFNLKLIIILWLSFSGLFITYLIQFSSKEGTPANPSKKWPILSQLRVSFEKPALLVFLHPQCSCSKATLGELERLMPYLKDRAEVLVVFSRPNGVDVQWTRNLLWSEARKIPGVTVLEDFDNIEANHFDSHTSGQTFLYDVDRNLVFKGGITAGRGHMGDSEGRNFIISWIQSRVTVKDFAAAVFGCSLTPNDLLSEDLTK